MGNGKRIIVKTYKGNQARAAELFQKDAIKLAAQGYYPSAQTWAPGTYGCGSFLFALLLCVILIGIIVFVYMLLVKPEGTLSVTYELRDQAVIPGAEKVCPKCAEQVKAAATVCRFCAHSFA